jgi:ABC-2 type transport system permease protein
MIAFLALIRREYLEHRTAFLYAPLILLAVLALFVASTLLTHRVTVLIEAVPGSPGRFYSVAYFVVATLWWFYAAMLLFFYFADAYHADARNNAMLFWKSMPQSDFKILLSKLAAGVTIFPGLVFCIALLSGLLLVVAALALPLVVPTLAMPDVSTLLASWGGLSVVFFCYLVIVLLWYVPFFAWVGALSTLVGRWAIPLALLIPVGISLFEGVIDFQTAPGGSYVLSFLRARTDMRYDSEPILAALLASGPVDVGHTLQRLVAYVDWPQTIGGVVFAVIVVYLASLYRRRVIKG